MVVLVEVDEKKLKETGHSLEEEMKRMEQVGISFKGTCDSSECEYAAFVWNLFTESYVQVGRSMGSELLCINRYKEFCDEQKEFAKRCGHPSKYDTERVVFKRRIVHTSCTKWEKLDENEIKKMNPAPGYVYSDSLGEMVIKAFIYKGERFEWDDSDCLYYSEYTDECWFEDIPVSPDNANLTILR